MRKNKSCMHITHNSHNQIQISRNEISGALHIPHVTDDYCLSNLLLQSKLKYIILKYITFETYILIKKFRLYA